MEVQSRLDRNPDLELSQKLFLLTRRDERDKSDIREDLMKAIRQKGYL
jgi:hypothetical protein